MLTELAPDHSTLPDAFTHGVDGKSPLVVMVETTDPSQLREDPSAATITVWLPGRTVSRARGVMLRDTFRGSEAFSSLELVAMPAIAGLFESVDYNGVLEIDVEYDKFTVVVDKDYAHLRGAILVTVLDRLELHFDPDSIPLVVCYGSKAKPLLVYAHNSGYLCYRLPERIALRMRVVESAIRP